MNTFDITILGGGMVGASLAAGLIDSSHTIELIDKNPLPPQKDHRLIALTKSSCDFFKSISIWENLLPFATAIKTVHVSQRGHFGSTRLSAKEIGASELGFVIPAEHINRVLYEKISQAKNITLKPNTTISNMSLRDLAISPSSHPSTSPSSGLSTSPSSRLSISPSSPGVYGGTREVKRVTPAKTRA
ncbi:MAG: hypothetical protein SFW66_02025, partial [Gammaproteobacteria bacterium]|nr:hypothetical protein [Gammaproteobacteria bacterium]